MKKFFAIALSFALVVSGITVSNVTKEEVKAADSWTLEWSDEFDGTSLDRTNWNVEVNGNGGGNNEKQYYLDSTENLDVSNGTLKIKALKKNYAGKSYTSGRINTKDKRTFKYGKIEARIKLPSFTGAWPAFWTLGQNYGSTGWPKCGEIDIMEAINTENHTYGYLHWHVESADYTGQGDTGGSSAGRLPSGYQRTDWHTYGIIWDENTIKWYIDDVVFRTEGISADHMSEFRKNQFIILNLAIGGNWPGFTIDDTAFPSKSVMEVDYVRVYKKVEEPTTPYDGPMITVTEDAVEKSTNKWGSYFGSDWAGANGSATPTASAKTGTTINVSAIGGDRWGVQAFLNGLSYYPGNTYTYSCTLTSDKDKVVFVKVAGDGDEEISGEYVSLKAGVPYNYTKAVAIDEDYEGVLDLYFGLGRCDGDTLSNNDGYNLTISNVSFVTTATIPDPEYVAPTQAPTNAPTQAPTMAPTEGTTEGNITTPDETYTHGAVVVGKTKVKKATKKLKAKKISLKLKKIKGAYKYQIQISKKKKFTKKNILVKKTVKKIKVTIKSKKIRNKKKLWVRARAWKKVNGKKFYGEWSKKKKVKVK